MAQRNAGDENSVKAAEHIGKRTREIELAEMEWLLAQPQGRRFIWRYLEKCGIFKTSFTGSRETDFLEGQRNVGLWLLADVNEATPEAYAVMLKEARQKGVNDDDPS